MYHSSHQIYIEMLSENGLVGTLVIIGIIFFLMFKILRQIFLSRNYIQVGSFVYIIVSLHHYYLVDLFLVTLI